jgi:ankyrin repeat protein
MAKFLITKKIEKNTVNKLGDTACHILAFDTKKKQNNNNSDSLRYLISAGCDITIPNKRGKTVYDKTDAALKKLFHEVRKKEK